MSKPTAEKELTDWFDKAIDNFVATHSPRQVRALDRQIKDLMIRATRRRLRRETQCQKEK